MEMRGLDTWDSHDVDWAQRGAEHAAEIITWGIFDRPMPAITLPDTDCDSLQTGYLLLTGTAPNRPDDSLCVHWAHQRDTTPARNPAI